MQTLKIATRSSPLALWQANYVAEQLKQIHPALTVELVPMTTKGDKILNQPLATIGGKGLFIKELEQGLLDHKADIAVHSMKDVPVSWADDFDVPVILERADARDAFVSNDYANLAQLPDNAIVGTSSLRRQAQLYQHYPQLQIKSLRGNINTRLNQLDQGDYHAIILASVGLQRLAFHERIKQYLEPEQMLPAIGQGALGIECRQGDTEVYTLIQALHHQSTALCVNAERAFNQVLEGGCQAPIAAYAKLNDDNTQIYLRGLVGQSDGKVILMDDITGNSADAETLGQQLAEKLLSQGARQILQQYS